MKSGSIIGIIQFLTAGLLILVSYLSFNQTKLYRGLTEILASSIRVLLPDIEIHLQIAQIIISIALATIAITIALLGRRTNIRHLCYFSFLLFLPTTQPFSAIDWLSFIGLENTLLSHSTLIQTLISGIILLFCYFTLISLSRLKETRKELTQRGGNAPEINIAINNGIASTLMVSIFSVLLAILAAFILITAQSSATAFALTIPYANIILGMSSVIAIIALIYYYLKERSS